MKFVGLWSLSACWLVLLAAHLAEDAGAYTPTTLSTPRSIATTRTFLERRSDAAMPSPYISRCSRPRPSPLPLPLPLPHGPVHSSVALLMGRAAAVRAATKTKSDAKKAKTNAMYGKKIIMAVKNGGSADTNANRQLADVIKAAKANSVPVDNIQRAIKKATDSDNASSFGESTFEAYGFGGASMVINVLSDNANRATADVRACVNKRGGKIAEQGSVLFMYDRRGKVVIPSAEIDEEDLLLAAIDAGCDDMELVDGDEENTSIVYTDPKDASKMVDAVKSLGFDDGVKMTLAWVSKAPVECADDDFEKNMEIIDALEDLDDVDSVEHNMSN